MSYPDLVELGNKSKELQDRWIAIDPRGGSGIAALRSGAVVVDYDDELDTLCLRLAAEEKTSLTILYCGVRPAA